MSYDLFQADKKWKKRRIEEECKNAVDACGTAHMKMPQRENMCNMQAYGNEQKKQN